MQGFLPTLPPTGRLRLLWLAALCALWLSAPALAADEGEGVSTRVGREAVPGAFCLPRTSSPWQGAAFGLALLAIRWQARRQPPASG